MNESYEPLITKNNSTAWAIKPAPKPEIFPPSGRQPSIQPYKGGGDVKEEKKKIIPSRGWDGDASVDLTDPMMRTTSRHTRGVCVYKNISLTLETNSKSNHKAKGLEELENPRILAPVTGNHLLGLEFIVCAVCAG